MPDRFDPCVHKRRSIRLKGYDYRQPGAYFVTICTLNREMLLGEIAEDSQRASQLLLDGHGRIATECWLWLAAQYPYVELDEWVVMPNHLHGILVLSDGRGGSRTAPTKPLGRLIGAFKTVSTKRMNDMRGTPGLPVWQRNYYEHIIRDEADLDRIRRYIAENPFRWADDENNPG